MKLIFIGDLLKKEIPRRSLVKIFVRSQFQWEIYRIHLEDLTKILRRKQLMKKTREDLHEIFYSQNLLEIFKSLLLKIFSFQNLRVIFQRKSINFSSKQRSLSLEDLQWRSASYLQKDSLWVVILTFLLFMLSRYRLYPSSLTVGSHCFLFLIVSDLCFEYLFRIILNIY